MNKTLFAASMVVLSASVAPACATKGFVRAEVGTVKTQGTTVEQTQQRIGQGETRIGAVDQKAAAAATAAAEASSTATEARGAADKAAAQVTAVGGRVDAVATEVAASRRLIFTVTLSEDQGNFAFGKADLPDTARTRVDQMIGQLKTNPQNVFIEIEGHTDNVGDAVFNEHLGLDRAEAVKRYLYEQHQVPLHKINVISYGEEKPVAPNNTRAGRAQNRRVVVKVLS